MKIVVTTPTGQIGSRVVQLLVQAGVRPTLLARVGEIAGLASTEEALGATGSSVLHLRCGYFYTNLDLDALRHGLVRLPAAIDYPQPWVDPRDIGDIAAARLLYSGWSGRNVQAVHGPEDLTLIQVAAILTEALARPIRAETISEDALRASLRAAGFGDKQVEGMVGMSAVMGDPAPPGGGHRGRHRGQGGRLLVGDRGQRPDLVAGQPGGDLGRADVVAQVRQRLGTRDRDYHRRAPQQPGQGHRRRGDAEPLSGHGERRGIGQEAGRQGKV